MSENGEGFKKCKLTATKQSWEVKPGTGSVASNAALTIQCQVVLDLPGRSLRTSYKMPNRCVVHLKAV